MRSNPQALAEHPQTQLRLRKISKNREAVRTLDPGASPLAHFGAEVRRARERHKPKLTLAQLGVFCHCDASVVSRVEGAECDPPDGFAEGCDAAFPEADGWFTRFLEDARKWNGGAVIPPWFRDWVEIEERARVIRWWEPVHVPGLLQTSDYAEGVFGTSKSDSPEEIRSKVTARVDRQRILDREAPPELWLLIGEDALHNQIGTKATMAAQFTQLIEMSVRPHISVQVVPESSRVYAGLARGGFFISTLDNADVVHFDNAVQGMTVHDPLIVEKAVYTFDRLRAEALPISATQELIAKVGERWRS